MSQRSLIYKIPEADIKQNYRKYLDIGIVGALLILIGVFYAFQKFETDYQIPEKIEEVFVVEDIPPQTQSQVESAPAGPAIPVEAESEEDIEDETIEDMDFEFEDIASNEAPPPPPDAEEDIIVPFAAVSDRPVLKKRVNPIYPELAKKAGLEGMVTVSVLIGTDGTVEQVKVLKSIPMLDEAAITAAKQYVFTPAKQRDRVVKVWMAIPIHFKLKG